MSRGKSSPIHQPEGRNRLLDRLLAGDNLEDAARFIGTTGKAAKRFAASTPTWAEQLRRARRMEPFEREPELPPTITLAPRPVATVVDAVPCAPIDRPAVTVNDGDSLGSMTRAKYHERMEEVFSDPSHPQWHHTMRVYASYFDGPDIIRARRRAEWESDVLDVGDKPLRVLVIRVPDNGTRGAK
jgi:hypothetical protein